jgi:alpha-galactosidase
MGWNSWNCWGGAVDHGKVLDAARALIDTGLADFGWNYVNIDDGWQGTRATPTKAIGPNSKFPDMKGLAADIHALGLRFGLYSSPWCGTYEGHIGSSCDSADGRYDWIERGDCNDVYRIGSSDHADWDRKRRTNYRKGAVSFVRADVASWVDWGIDYLKYDWKPIDADSTREVSELLAASGRDVVLSLSNKAPYWGAATWAKLANCWRTTADIQDTWASIKAIGFNQDRWAPWNGPGHWNDPDMLVIGRVGWGPSVRPTRLSQEEQCTHVSLWCLLSAPLLLGCDLRALDAFTRKLLTNDEVLAVNQDEKGVQAVRIHSDDGTQILAKPLGNGALAIGFFNTSEADAELSLDWDDLHIEGARLVRDLWSRSDEGLFSCVYRCVLPPHGCKLVTLSLPPAP